MKRSKNLKILVYLQFFYCSFLLTVYLFTLLVKPVTLKIVEIALLGSVDNSQATKSSMYETILLFTPLGIISSLIGLLIAYGLLKCKILAWICSLISQILDVLNSLIYLFIYNIVAPKIYSLILIFYLIIACATIYYLFERDVFKAFFK